MSNRKLHETKIIVVRGMKAQIKCFYSYDIQEIAYMLENIRSYETLTLSTSKPYFSAILSNSTYVARTYFDGKVYPEYDYFDNDKESIIEHANYVIDLAKL